MKKWQIVKFSILPYSQNRKLGFKNLGKKFLRFPSFRPGWFLGQEIQFYQQFHCKIYA